jgi:predicted GIY-YIG superfamily endonuclease
LWDSSQGGILFMANKLKKIISDNSNKIMVDAVQYNKCLEDPNLSLKAKGMFAFILASDQEFFTCYDFAIRGSEKIDAIKSGLQELVDNGYVYYGTLENGEGWVYIIGDTYGNYKIGLTNDLEKRLNSYRTSMPNEPEIIAVIQTKDMQSLEKQLHIKYKDRHIKNEWFRLTNSDLLYLKSLEGSAVHEQLTI